MHGDIDNNNLETLTKTPSSFEFDQLEYKQAEHYSLPLVKSFYKKNGMRAQAPKGDLVYVVTLNQAIIAAVRLHPVNQAYLLRSMCVQANLRQQGIGSQLLNYLQAELNHLECYSFPYTHLVAFYSRANFIKYDSQLVPESISNKFKRYINNGKKICLMKHQAAAIRSD